MTNTLTYVGFVATMMLVAFVGSLLPEHGRIFLGVFLGMTFGGVYIFYFLHRTILEIGEQAAEARRVHAERVLKRVERTLLEVRQLKNTT